MGGWLIMILLLFILSFFNEYPLAIFPTLIVSGKQTIHTIDMSFHTKVVEIHKKYTLQQMKLLFIYSLLYIQSIQPCQAIILHFVVCLLLLFLRNFFFSAWVFFSVLSFWGLKSRRINCYSKWFYRVSVFQVGFHC